MLGKVIRILYCLVIQKWYDALILSVDPASNPFVYGRPVAPEDLIDRDGEARQLVELAWGNHNARLSAPRRFGKTSLLSRVRADAEREGFTSVYVDFSGVVSMEEVANRIEEAYSRSLHTALQRALAWARSTVSSVNFGADEASLGIGLRDPDRARLLFRLLDLPAQSFERSGLTTLVVFDEFQAVLGASDNADALIRSRIQHHGNAASYVFAGSHPGMMRELFAAKERPLYGQARPVDLAPLRDDDLAEYITDRFERTGRSPGDLLGDLLGLARGHPQRAMLVSHHLWEATDPGTTSVSQSWPDVLESAFGELEEAFEAVWRGWTGNQKRFMRLLASGEQSIFSEKVLSRFGVSRGSVAGIRDALLAEGDIERRDRAFVIVDPLLEVWIANGRRPPREW